MTPDSSARLVLLSYLAIGVGIVVWQFRRSGLGLSTWFLWVVERLYVPFMFHWRANRRCPFPGEEGALILANHRSPVDPLLIWMNNHLGERPRRCRVTGFLMAREYYDIPGLTWVGRAMQCIPVCREGKDMRPAREALERLKRGDLIGVFPEGGINEETALREGDTGIAWLALHAQVPVFPVFLRDSPTSENMVKPFYTRCRVKVVYGEPIDLSAYYDQKRTRTLLREVTDLLMRRLAELGGVSYAPDLPVAGRVNTTDPSHDVPRATG
ncbi:MAG TPA: lysophospholipid acyltransferase family protein [Planctomycetaceae bacterium]|jgi:1-acyl-sn-glycerol-3-phosphate acyltransferase|nr:lysophospholipid acyltransferase family protein [Planctomycetaceae bacterium]